MFAECLLFHRRGELLTKSHFITGVCKQTQRVTPLKGAWPYLPGGEYLIAESKRALRERCASSKTSYDDVRENEA